MKKTAKYMSIALIITAYFAAVVFEVKFFTYLLSPFIMFAIFISVFKAFYLKQTNWALRIAGLFLSMSILTWSLVDIIWWGADYILNLEQETLYYITFGYSSLSYFKVLPADRIKLARELIEYIHVDDFDYQLVKSIIMLAKAKGIRVIAEGVEKKEQWEVLKELQCDEVQGYYFGRAVPVWEAVMFLKQI